MSAPPNGPPPPYYSYPAPGASGFTYVPTPVMMPVYTPPPPQPEPPKPTYVTNYIYQQPAEPVHVVHESIEWAPATPNSASALTHRAFVAGKEGWDGSPIWVIRAHHSGEFVPGKLAIKSRAAYIPHAGKEVPVHHFEVLLAQPHMVRWVSSSHGHLPAGAIPAGNSHNGEPLYIARVHHERSLTPGKVHPSHGCCYISFGGSEISYKTYEVLCNNI